jgi:ketosteroid isomerase-like protein
LSVKTNSSLLLGLEIEMAIMLPGIVADYFEADRGGDAGAVAQCFTAEAVVRDEGRTHAGRDAIRAWKAQTTAKYIYTAEPLAIATSGGQTVVTSRLVGDFPGSPVDLRYLFVIADGAIAGLEIKP